MKPKRKLCVTCAGIALVISVYIYLFSATKVSPTFVLVFAYMRSGSSLTGDIIQQDPTTLYSFEPLYNVWDGNSSTFANGEEKFYANATDKDKTEEGLRQLRAWYTCNLMNVDLETLRFMFMDVGLKTRSTKTCMTKYDKKHFNNTVKENCITPLIQQCEGSSVRVVKELRFYARDIKPLLQDFPKFKMIYLVRDPRGILASWKRVDHINTASVPMLNLSKSLCQRIMEDYNTIQYFTKAYPERIMKLRYEELATYPLDTVKRIYEFIGMEATERILETVKNMTSLKSNIERDYETARKNSVYTANAWRVKISLNDTDIIDSTCSDVYDKYGYIKVKSDHHLRNIHGELLWTQKINL